MANDAIMETEDGPETASDDKDMLGDDTKGPMIHPADTLLVDDEELSDLNDPIDATLKHTNNLKEAWESIKKLEGEEVALNHTVDGKVVWRVVKSVTDDVFREIHEYQTSLIHEKNKFLFLMAIHLVVQTLAPHFGSYGQVQLKKMWKN